MAKTAANESFSATTTKREGKATSGFWKESMVFKLTDEAKREQALALEGAERFDPDPRRSLATPIRGHAGLAGVAVRSRRPMREWVVVPASHSGEWPRLAQDALSL